MKNLSHRVLVPLVGLLLVPAAADAVTLSFQCGMSHYVRSAGTELVSSTLTVRNTDADYAATILRLTIRDGDGNVIHESGPTTPTPLPLNTDFPVTAPSGRDVTRVLPGGAVYLRSNHLWGSNGLPGAAGNETGQILSASLVVTKEGKPSALAVSSTQRMRTRASGPTPGSFIETDTRATGTVACESLP